MVRQVYHSLLDNLEVLVGKRDKFTPPRRLLEKAGGAFGRPGEEFFRHCLEQGQLKPDGCVLEVGCGCGQLAAPLAKYLSRHGGYWGFDIVVEGVAWCQKSIGADHRNFHFLLADVWHKHHHPKGRFKAAEYRFPYLDDYFDLVAVTSDFTRMPALEMGNYLEQIARVLKPGGRCVLSFFLLNAEAKGLLRQGLGAIKFPRTAQNCMMSRRRHAEEAVAFEEDFIRQSCAARNLEMLDPVCYGSWCGRQTTAGFYDIVAAVRKPKAEAS